MTVKTKEQLRKYKESTLAKVKGALRNSLLELHKMGMTSAKVYCDEKGNEGYLAIRVSDIVKVIGRRCTKAVEKCAKNFTVKVYLEKDVEFSDGKDDVLVILVTK